MHAFLTNECYISEVNYLKYDDYLSIANFKTQVPRHGKEKVSQRDENN